MLRRIDSLLRRYVGIIILVVLGVLAWNSGLLSIFAGETALEWQGQTWAYKTDGGAPAIDGNSVSLSLACNDCVGIGQSSYLRSDFELGKLDEIRLNVVGSTTAHINANSASGSGSASVNLNSISIYSLSSSAEERGGSYIPVDSDSLTQALVLRRSGDAWNVYVNEIKVKTVSDKNPTLKIVSSVGGNYGGGTSNIKVYVAMKVSALSVAPAAPAAPTMASLVATLKSWLSKLLDAIPFLTITGQQSPSLGTTQTYTVNLASATPLDSDFADGTYAVRYCNVALMRSDGTVISEKGFETCTNSYSTTYTAAIPTKSGRYAVVTVMAESKGTFDTTTQSWAFQPYEIVAQEAINVDTRAPIPGASSVPLKPASGNIFARIWQSLFGWLF